MIKYLIQFLNLNSPYLKINEKELVFTSAEQKMILTSPKTYYHLLSHFTQLLFDFCTGKKSLSVHMILARV